MILVPRIFRRFVPQILHTVILPVFFFLFMLIYQPFHADQFLGGEWFGVHVTILSCIIFVSLILTRLLYYFLPLRLNYTLYSLWALGEISFASFFAALYLWLVLHKSIGYFSILADAFKYFSLTLAIPYLILALSLTISDLIKKSSEPESNAQRMRFYDDKHNLKIVLQATSILYISAEINYVNIYYLDSGNVKNYVLRSSMKALEEICQMNGLLRCHRSYYINPKHVKVLRKDKDGAVFAELDANDIMDIPVTKRYYDSLSDMLV